MLGLGAWLDEDEGEREMDTDGEVHRDARRVESSAVSRRSRYVRRTSNRGAQSQGLNEIDSN